MNFDKEAKSEKKTFGERGGGAKSEKKTFGESGGGAGAETKTIDCVK